MSILIPTHHLQFMNHAKNTSCSIIYISLIIQSYSTKTDHSGTNRHPNTARSRPTPRSGWGISLKRDSLAQAIPPSPRRGLKKEQESNAGSRLGETPLAWASCVLAQNTLWSPGRPLEQKALGEPLHNSPGRVYQCSPLFAPAQHTQQRFQTIQTFIAMHNLKEFIDHDNTS